MSLRYCPWCRRNTVRLVCPKCGAVLDYPGQTGAR